MQDVPQGSGTTTTGQINPESLRLAETYISCFWAANHEIKWLALEQELSLWLSPNTLLVGKVDGIGETPDSRLFFLENKTASKYKKAKIIQEKATWRMRPQSLTYGVLLGSKDYQEAKPYTNSSEINPIRELVRTFTTRWTFKTEPPSCDFAWFSYSDYEIEWWKGNLLDIAEEIRHYRKIHFPREWPTNLNYCTKYGEKYACAFRDQGCWALNFGFVPESMTPRTESHLRIENELKDKPDDLVVLDATRVNDWINCHELYRRMWEGQGLRESSEALEIGGDFHKLLDAHLSSIMRKES